MGWGGAVGSSWGLAWGGGDRGLWGCSQERDVFRGVAHGAGGLPGEVRSWGAELGGGGYRLWGWDSGWGGRLRYGLWEKLAMQLVV